MGKYIAGQSDGTGFCICDLNGLTAASREYGYRGYFKMFVYFIVILAAIFIGVCFSFPSLVNAPFLVLFGLISGLIVFRYNEREFYEWHATEHKVIQLLESGKLLTLENLREMPMTSKYCGANNTDLKLPPEKKLKEALKVAKQYRRLWWLKFE